MDEDTTVILSNGFNNGKDQPPEYINQIEIKDSIELPQEGGYMELPIEVELPSGMKTRYLNVLPENIEERKSYMMAIVCIMNILLAIVKLLNQH